MMRTRPSWADMQRQSAAFRRAAATSRASSRPGRMIIIISSSEAPTGISRAMLGHAAPPMPHFSATFRLDWGQSTLIIYAATTPTAMPRRHFGFYFRSRHQLRITITTLILAPAPYTMPSLYQRTEPDDTSSARRPPDARRAAT